MVHVPTPVPLMIRTGIPTLEPLPLLSVPPATMVLLAFALTLYVLSRVLFPLIGQLTNSSYVNYRQLVNSLAVLIFSAPPPSLAPHRAPLRYVHTPAPLPILAPTPTQTSHSLLASLPVSTLVGLPLVFVFTMRYVILSFLPLSRVLFESLMVVDLVEHWSSHPRHGRNALSNNCYPSRRLSTITPSSSLSSCERSAKPVYFSVWS